MKQLILYGLASGFNRGGMFLILPLLSSLLSIADYGQFSIYIVIVQLLVPFISLNIVSIVGREIFEKFRVTVYFTVFFVRCATIIILLCSLMYYYYTSVILLIVIYALMESLFLIISTFVRFKSSSEYYFYICVSKMVLLIFLLAFFYYAERNYLSSVSVLLMIFSLSNLSMVLPYWRFLTGVKVRNRRLIATLSKQSAIILFALGILPHTLAQWVTSGADRFFVKYYGGEIQLGYYSYGYAIAAVYMVVNSALALGMPQLCVQKFATYSATKFFTRYKYFVTVLWLAFFAVVNIGLFTIKTKYSVSELYWVIYFVLVGMYFLSYYYYYSSYLFYARKSKLLSGITITTALVNIGLILVLTPLLGIKGTAMSTAGSYGIYTCLTYYYASKFYKIKGVLFPVVFIIFFTILIYLIDIYKYAF
ncbi:polysaccharide biosynthesis C-terminal domain-containing protein [Escherichia coli]|uniref:polysaccharide biosynthesis C-terminal domain-containing protein n=1 Tax=Escherichia coli TaxID=562 RepID=UPI000DD83CDB|nr:polysaccharide biosynthesis C-terminal domain-containing protein [Escherichia coli]EIT4643091.1 polysaccharide biosynthesis C-terminal domain-containing protein [Escherichia coli]MDI4463173.1 polysaccharide biosynthesis protein [Escherichia coli]